ncbi:GIY-YIG nuclease family protein [Minwuia sp.]|uniref:GIY-YIG nuclease family protein n=1 Tax=Minwuia sp. TaxID=2493630 RepID=UPI003A8F44CD
MKYYYVYLLTNAKYGAFYVGMTSDLVRRCQQHCAGIPNSFTNRYSIKHLVWYETHAEFDNAVRREKRIKRWTRAQKFDAIEALNPEWRNLAKSHGGTALTECPHVPDPRVCCAKRG